MRLRPAHLGELGERCKLGRLGRRASAALALPVACLLAAAAGAANIASVTASVGPGGQVTATVLKGGSGNCGARILWGDPANTIGAPFGFNTNPRTFTHPYPPGTYTITAQPRKKGNLAKCSGSAKTTLVTIDPDGGGSGGGGITLKAAPAGAAGGLTTVPPKPQGPMKAVEAPESGPLVAKIITGVNVTPGAHGADFRVTSGVPAFFQLRVFESYPARKCDPGYPTVEGRASFFPPFATNPRTVWDGKLTDLQPKTDYYYEVCAFTESELKDRADGTFFTGHRNATVQFTNVHVIDDGDGGAAGAGEIFFHFWIDGDLVRQEEASLDSGTNWDPQIGRNLSNVGDQIRIEVAAYERDDEAHFMPGPGGVGVMIAEGGEHSDTSRAKGVVYVSPDRPGDEEFTKSFSFLSDHKDVQFRVDGKVKVSVGGN